MSTPKPKTPKFVDPNEAIAKAQKKADTLRKNDDEEQRRKRAALASNLLVSDPNEDTIVGRKALLGG